MHTGASEKIVKVLKFSELIKQNAVRHGVALRLAARWSAMQQAVGVFRCSAMQQAVRHRWPRALSLAGSRRSAMQQAVGVLRRSSVIRRPSASSEGWRSSAGVRHRWPPALSLAGSRRSAMPQAVGISRCSAAPLAACHRRPRALRRPAAADGLPSCFQPSVGHPLAVGIFRRLAVIR